ncbi:MAG: flagellar filament capping protein FliD [Candidatus Kapabacteria bacterium]|nr:flagellar filament capping protein FliD [Candidatus Kapabacteria bacterium]
MADALTNSVASSMSGKSNTALDQVENAYRQTQQYRLDALTTKQNTLQNNQKFYNNLLSQLNTVISNIDTFTAQNASNNFVTRGVTSSDATVMTATTTSDAAVAVNQIKVDRLATNDNLISKRLKLTDKFLSIGTQTFKIKVGTNSFDVSVDLTADMSNEDALKAIAKSINTAVTTTTNSVSTTYASASFVKDTLSSGRLTISSISTGSTNAISFEDSPLLAELGITNSSVNSSSSTRKLATTLDAGYKTTDSANLDSKLNVNGIEVFRDTNTVSDVLSGITLTLLKPQLESDIPITMTTSIDVAAVTNFVKPMLDHYNSLLNFVKSNTSSTRGDTAVNSLFSRLRSITSTAITPQNGGTMKYLSEMGIKVASDGTVSVADSAVLKTALEKNPLDVANLFTGPDGFASQLNSIVSSLTGDGGIIKSKTLALGNQINLSSKQTVSVQKSIDQQAAALRKQYTATLQTYLKAQGQYQTLLGTTSSTQTSSTG